MSNIKNNIPLILSFIIYFIAALIASHMMYTTSDSFLIMLIIELAMLFVGIMIHLIVHEAGHMVFGLLTHYGFSSFRIGS